MDINENEVVWSNKAWNSGFTSNRYKSEALFLPSRNEVFSAQRQMSINALRIYLKI